MSALIPAIIQFVLSRRRGGGGGGGGYGGGGGEDSLEDQMRKYMNKQFLYSLDNFDTSDKETNPRNPRGGSSSESPRAKFSPVVPGVFSTKPGQ